MSEEEPVTVSASGPSVAPPPPRETGKQRADRLRKSLRARGPEGREQTVIVKQKFGQAPAGMRIEMIVDTSTSTWALNFVPHSAEGAEAFLESIRWVMQQVGVDFDLKRIDPVKAPESALV